MVKTSRPILGYNILEKLGESTHAEVFKVFREDEPNRLLALKLIKPEIISKDLYYNLDQQIKYLNGLDLPKVIIPTLHKDGEETIFLIQEYFDGMNLEEWGRSQEKVSLSEFGIRAMDSLALDAANRYFSRCLSLLSEDSCERKSIEEELKVARQEREGIFQAIGNPTLILDSERNVISANIATCKAVDKSEEELVGKKCYQLLHGIDHPPKSCPFGRVLKSGRLETVEMEVEELDTVFLVSCTPIFDGSGDINKIIHVAMDLTEQKKDEENLLRQKEEETRLLTIEAENKNFIEWMNTFDTFVAKYDPDGNMFFCNDAALRGTGVKKEDVYGMYFPDAVFWEHSEVERSKIVECFNKAKLGITSRIETNFGAADGTRIPIIFDCRPIMDEKGDVKYITAEGKTIIEQVRLRKELQKERENLEVRVLERTMELEDLNMELSGEIVERKQTENELARYRDHLEDLVKDRTTLLEAANRELESFSYSVSHDLRAPLRSMDGFGTALLEDYGDKLDEKGVHYIDRIKDSSQRMATLIDDILELSHVTRRKISNEDVDLTQVARSIIEDLRAEDPDRKIDVMIQDGLSDRGDPILIKQALENLLSNSWKFTGMNPRAKIEFGALEIEGEKSFFVRDNGIGFDMQYQDKLFVPFQRLHSMEEFTGTGIGLATVQRIIHRHGGEIRGDGEPEKGATFYIRFSPSRGRRDD